MVLGQMDISKAVLKYSNTLPLPLPFPFPPRIPLFPKGEASSGQVTLLGVFFGGSL